MRILDKLHMLLFPRQHREKLAKSAKLEEHLKGIAGAGTQELTCDIWRNEK
jgi:hypothetical protein